jgi:hypothetical protein
MRTFLLLFLLTSTSLVFETRGNELLSERDALSKAMSFYDDSLKCNFWIGEISTVTAVHQGVGSFPFAWLTDTLVGKWMVFVDEAPQSNWGHPCSFFYFPKLISENLDSIPWFRVTGNKPPRQTIYPYSKTLKRVQRNIQVEAPLRDPLPGDLDFCDNRNNDLVALILATGDMPSTNYSRFMKDANYLYGVLDQKYGICPYNIYLLSGSENFHGLAVDSYTNEYVSQYGLFNNMIYGISYGTDEGGGYATYENVKRVLHNIAQDDSMVDKHFLFFYSGHGDTIGGYSLSLPSETLNVTQCNPQGYQTIPLYASELNDLLDSIPCRAMTVVLGQCFSGGFVDSIAAPNRVVLAACQPDEVSFSDYYGQYNVFLRNWTDAVNENDSIGLINSDVDSNGRVTIKESFDYAQSKEIVNNYDGELYEEHPMYSSVHAALGEDLAINLLPDSVDLFIRDNIEDTGKEYNMTIEPTWNSPDIWLRNQNDGFENNSHENIITDSLSSYAAYIYTKVSNRGLGDYESGSKKLTLYWVNTAIGTNPAAWFAPPGWSPRIPACGLISSACIDSFVESDSCIIISTQWNIPSYLLRSPMPYVNTTNIGLLAVVDDTVRMNLDNLLVYNLLKDKEKLNDVALKNMTILNTTVDTLTHITPSDPIIIPIHGGVGHIGLNLMGDSIVFSDLDLSIELSDALYESWLNEGGIVQDAMEDAYNPKKFHIVGKQNKISGIKINNEVDFIKLYCNPIAKERQFGSDALFHLLVKDSIGNKQDAMAFQMHLQPRIAMTPEIEAENNKYQATNIFEPAIFEWFDETNTKIGTGNVFQPDFLESSELRLKVTALSDGAVANAHLSIINDGVIERVYPIPFADYVGVVLKKPAIKDYQIKLWSGDGTLLQSCALLSGEREVSINTRYLPQGRFVLTLLVDDKIIESRNLVKLF